MIMAARAMAMATATKKVMVTNRNNTKRGWQASDNGDDGNGECYDTKDMAAHTTPVERGMMVAMGHGLCVSLLVSEEMTKIKMRAKT
jgi:hypothetical protein